METTTSTCRKEEYDERDEININTMRARLQAIRIAFSKRKLEQIENDGIQVTNQIIHNNSYIK